MINFIISEVLAHTYATQKVLYVVDYIELFISNQNSKCNLNNRNILILMQFIFTDILEKHKNSSSSTDNLKPFT